MNTPAHLVMGLNAFGRAGRPGVTSAALVGSLLPDLSLYLLVAWHMWVVGTSPDVIFGQLYFSEQWHRIFRVDNSIVLWGCVLGAGLWARWPVAIALSGAALLHLGFDFLLHHDDGRAHFWPLSNWIFESPVSYWDGDHHGDIIGPLEAAMSIGLCVILWRRFKGVFMRGLIITLAAAEAVPVIAFLIMFNAQ